MHMLCRLLSSKFTRSLSQFHNFVNPIVTKGGKDTPEDVMGALKVTFTNLSWRSSATKVFYKLICLLMFHIL